MKKMIITFLLMIMTTADAAEVAGIKIDDKVAVSGLGLQLNGAGIRTKFIFDIYVAALYTRNRVKTVEDLDFKSPIRVAMHFLYDEVSKEKLVDAWNEGFENNLDSSELKKQRENIDHFNTLFETVKKGDVIVLDYIPGRGTFVTINEKEKGRVSAGGFFKDLIMIWLGPVPISDALKSEMLGEA